MSEYGSCDSDSGSGFWAPPEKPDYEAFKSQQPHESEFSDSYQDSSSEIEDVESEKEVETVKEYIKKGYRKNKNRIIKNFKGDEGKPFYVPRKPHFFEHDIRILDDEEEIKVEKGKKYKKTLDFQCWKHDLFNEDEQQPKSEIELVDTYGYDIRSDNPTSIGQKTFREKITRNKKYEKSHNFQNGSVLAYIDKKPINQREMVSNQSTEIEKGVRERTSLKKAIYKRNPYDVSCGVDVQQFEKLTIRHLDVNDKSYCGKHKDSQMGAIPTTFMRNGKRDPSQRLLFLDKENTSLKYVVDPQTMNHTHIPSSFQNQRESDVPSHNTKDGSVFSFDPPVEIKTKVMTSSYETIVQNVRSNGEYVRRTQCSMPGIEKSYGIVGNFTSVNNVHPTYLEELYKMGNRENPEFPDPPDLSAAHLMPCSPYPQYFIHPFYQQDIGSLMKWEFFDQQYYPTSSIGGFAFIKQPQLDCWVNPQHHCHPNVIPPPRHVGANPFYALLNYGTSNLQQSSLLPNSMHTPCFRD